MNLQPEQFCETTARVGSVPVGEQLIFRREVARLPDPLLEFEYKGKRACAHLSEIKPLPFYASEKARQA